MSTEVVVTRAGQITLTKDIRERMGVEEGDVVIISSFGNQAVVTKRDPSVFKRFKPFLAHDFDAVLKKMRGPAEPRLKRLGVTR